MKARLSGTFFLIGLVATVWCGLVLIAGGVTVRVSGAVLASRDPVRPFLVACAALLTSVLISATDARKTARRILGTSTEYPRRVAAIAAVAAFIVAMAWNTRAAGGSDSACYVLQAEAFARGHALLWHPLAGRVGGLPPAALAPTGFIPSPQDPYAAAPICAPGLALVMAIARVFGTHAMFAVVPLSAGFTVWLTFVFARRATDDLAGATAACLLACSPIFLYQAVQPMSDVPAALFFLAALTATGRGDRFGAIAGGLCASLAVLTRPNLVPAIVPLLWLLPDRPARMRWIAGAVPGAVVLAVLNAIRYGSPLATGYGSAGDLFATAHVAANLSRYPRWLVETQSPMAVLAVAAPWAVRGDGARSRLAIVSLVASALVIAPYLVYTVFDDWWYLRFLLPVLPVLLAYSVAVVLRVVPGRARVAAAVGLACVLGAWCLSVAVERHVFELQRLESRFALTGAYAAHELPSDAVVLAVQQSSSIRFYAGIPTIAWGAVPADGLDTLVTGLQSSGRPVFAALEDAETQPFRERFVGQRCGALVDRPVGEVSAAVRVRLYRLSC
jgi:hypothetical protein